ncbi:MAG: hypothetical protein KIT44_02780 [Opitutaceae bacterium]|nr:hypothetical protein [Opitutaceae bacterium]
MRLGAELSTQRGKLSVLPFCLLLDLNLRLLNGESHAAVLAWLNALPIVRRRMRMHFEGRPLIAENISSWHHRDYRYWLQHIRQASQGAGKPLPSKMDARRQRKGKIARLPQEIRDEVSRRLHDGVPGFAIVEWLNEQPAVIDRLRAYFHGAPVTSQNLSEWRLGGYQDYLRRLEGEQHADR